MIIIIDPDQRFHEHVADALRSTRWEPLLTPVNTVTEAIEVLRSAPQVQAAIGGPNLTLDEGLLLAEHATSSKSGAVVLLVAEPTTEVLRRAMRAGARDVLSPQFESSELAAALTDAGVSSSGPAPLPGLTISVLGVKGGVGASVVASNLAIRLAESAAASVTLADLDLASADLAVMHSVSARWTIQDLADGTVGIDHDSLRDILHSVGDSGARLLPGPVDPALAERITAADVGNLVALLRSESPLVVLDLATSFDDRTLTALDATDLLVLTCGLDVASLRGLTVALRTLEQLGVEASRIRVALVRADSKAGLTVADVERTIGRPVDLKLPSTRSVPRSVNEGTPLALSSPRSSLVKAVDELVADVLSLLPQGLTGQQVEAGDSGRRRFLGLGRDEAASARASAAPFSASAGRAAEAPGADAPEETPEAADDGFENPTASRPRVVRRVVGPTESPASSRDKDGRTVHLAAETLPPPVPIDRARRESATTTENTSGLAGMPPPVVSDDHHHHHHHDDDHRGGRHLRRS